MRRRLFLPGLAGLLLLVVCVWQMLPKHRISQESFNEIKVGMTESEVIANFGVLAGAYADLITTVCCPPATLADSLDYEKQCPGWKGWYGPTAWVQIEFTPDGRVSSKQLVTLHHETPFKKFFRWPGF